MSSKTSAVEWADVGEMALTLERLDEASTCFEKGNFSSMIMLTRKLNSFLSKVKNDRDLEQLLI